MSEVTNYKKKNQRKLLEKFAKDNKLENVEIFNNKDAERTREGTTQYSVWNLKFEYKGGKWHFDTDGRQDPFCEHHSPASEMLANIEEELDLPVVFGKDGY